MIFGAFEKSAGVTADPQRVESARRRLNLSSSLQSEVAAPGTAFVCGPTFDTAARRHSSGIAQSERTIAAVSGQITNLPELASYAAASASDAGAGVALGLYERFGADCFSYLRGCFVVAIWDKRERQCLVARDPLGIEPLYYADDDERFVFSSRLAGVSAYRGGSSELDYQSIAKILVFNYNPGPQTALRGVERLRPGHRLTVDESRTARSRYWKLSFSNVLQDSEAAIASKLAEHMDAAVRRNVGEGDEVPAVFLSGGLDSSSVVGLASRATGQQIKTFSYRCRGESYDESKYAKLMADSVKSNHALLEFDSSDVLLMPEIVREMDEPFSDIGINIATYVLGRGAQGAADYVLTGDGGDELFGGHPVYEADKMARYIDAIPGFALRPLLSLGRLLPDSDNKKDLTVKLKRFAESLSFPPWLYSHRWRVYYDARELSRILSPDARSQIDSDAIFEDVREINSEADTNDLLGRSLYSDYQTVVDFYVRRNALIGRFGLETRFPLLDQQLVEYCASIPTALKIRGWFDSKYIQKKAMEDVLPHGIVYREDKLGHSIPLKNWMRDDRAVREFVVDNVQTLAKREDALLDARATQTLIEDHMSKKRNNSHRLWSIAVLGMWLRDGGPH